MKPDDEIVTVGRVHVGQDGISEKVDTLLEA